MNVLTSIAVLGFLIFFHEMGHFLAAILQGIYVDGFSIGFGPSIIQKRYKNITYSLRAFPLGGFVSFPDEEINKIYSSLRSQKELDSSNYTSQVFIIDKQRNQRGRIDDRDDDQIEKNVDLFGLYSYNSIIVSEIKKKMNDDIRILFTEYRQKRKGNFNSNIRRISNLDGNDK